MASRIEVTDVTIAAGTLQSAPATVPTPFDDGRVDRIEILIPPGPSGLVGFQIVHSNIPVIPRETDRFIVADNEVIQWPIEDFPVGGSWGVRGYNEDVYDHTLYLRFLITETERGSAGPLPPVEVDQPEQPAPIDEAQEFEVPPIDLKPAPNPDGYPR